MGIKVDDAIYTNQYTSVVICDGEWHTMNMYISKQAVRIIQDGAYSLRKQTIKIAKGQNSNNNKSNLFKNDADSRYAMTEKLNMYDPKMMSGTNLQKPSLLIGAYYDKSTRSIRSDYRGCLRNLRMITNQSCPVPDGL